MKKILVVVLVFMLFTINYAQDCKHARILGATWGNKDVTAKVAHAYNLGTKSFNADSQVLGEAMPGQKKTFTLVYEICQNVATLAANEGELISIP